MELKDILAIRLKTLKDARPDLDTQIKIHKKTGLSQSTVQRVLAADVHTGLDVLQALADAFGLPPLELLRPIEQDDGLDALNIAPNYDENKLVLTWRKLSDEDKHRVMAYLSVATQTKKRQHTEQRQLNVDAQTQAPKHIQAAHKRAAGRASVSETDFDVTHNEKVTKGKKTKRHA